MRVYFLQKFYSGVLKDSEIKKYIQRTHDKPTAKVFMRRISNARAAASLQVVLQGGFPGHWELLKGDRYGQISATLRGAKRLICIPDGNLKDFSDEENNIDTKLIQDIVVIDIEDNYHK